MTDLATELAPILPSVAAAAAEAEKQRAPSRSVMTALGEAGLTQILVPNAYGGRQAHLRDVMELTERLGRVHASLGWTAMTCNEEAGLAAAYLEPDDASAFFGANPTTVIAGSGIPRGKATEVEGGWRVSGQWPFVSGCTASDFLVLANTVVDTSRATPSELCFVVVPTSETSIVDTWHTIGLRGTGSHDVVLEDHFVPGDRAGVTAIKAPAKPDTPFFRLPSGLRFPFPKVGLATGIARAALDEFLDLASGKRPLQQGSTLNQRATAQAAVAEATARLGAGRAWVSELLDELWEVVDNGQEIPPELHARCRLGCSHAVSSCIEAVERLVAEAGSTANFTTSPLGQQLNDLRAISAHYVVAPYRQQSAGRVLLGLDPDDPSF